MARLAGRVVLITGSTGIGAATAERAAAEGASVFVVSRSAEHARTLAERLPIAGWAETDLTDEVAVDRAVTASLERFGRIDGLFSVAGGSGRRFGDGPIHTVTGEAWEATAALNLRTQVLVCSRVVQAMRDQPADASGMRGSILLLGSITTEAPVPELFGTHAYAAAKGALSALMTTMAATYIGDRIRVNLVAPSLTATPMAARAAADPHILEYAARKQPLAGSMLDPDEVAGWSIVSTTAEPKQKARESKG